MTYSPTVWDFAVLTVLLVSFAVNPVVAGRIKAAIESRRHPNARLQLYWFKIGTTWSFTLIVFAVWFAFRRPWSALWLGVPNGWLLIAGLLVAAAHLWYILRSRNRMLANVDNFPRYRELLNSVSLVAPRTPRERRLFAVVAVTAGIGEEVLLRGFVFSLFASMFGLWIGGLVNVVIFGLAHAYQGRGGIIRTGAFGAFLTVVVVATGSLVPAVLIHTVQDLIAGDIVSRVLSAAPSAESDNDLAYDCATVPV